MATTVISGGLVFDGSGADGRRADVLIADGTVRSIGVRIAVPDGAERIDATGCWVPPGFVDLHTHYDAEIEFAPALGESVRHGITTVLVGSCGLSFAVGEPEDLADMFCRVKGIPRDDVLPKLRGIVDWTSPTGYLEHLDTLPLAASNIVRHVPLVPVTLPGIEFAPADKVFAELETRLRYDLPLLDELFANTRLPEKAQPASTETAA